MSSQVKAGLKLAVLFVGALLATSAVKTEIYAWVYVAKIEGPHYFSGGILTSWAFLLAFTAVVWLQRERVGRVLAAMGAGISLLLCVDSAQMMLWCARLLRYADFGPFFAASAHLELWGQLAGASTAFTLSALSLWLCARAAGPKAARPLASWGDWKNWNLGRGARARNAGALD